MRRIALLVIMLIGIPYHVSAAQAFKLIYNTVSQTYEQASRSYRTWHDLNTHLEMFGLDFNGTDNSNSGEYSTTVDCATYLLQLKTLNVNTYIKEIHQPKYLDMMAKREKRVLLFRQLAKRILEDTEEDGLGSIQSKATIERITRLNEMSDAFGDILDRDMLELRKQEIIKNISDLSPAPGKKSSLSEQRSTLLQNITTQQPTTPGTPSTLPQTLNAPSTTNASISTTTPSATTANSTPTPAQAPAVSAATAPATSTTNTPVVKPNNGTDTSNTSLIKISQHFPH